MSGYREVLDFWFGGSEGRDFGRRRKAWFSKDPAFDAEIRAQFLATYLAAAAGELEAWGMAADSALAQIIVLDQFPRNMFRGTPRVFATDKKALATATRIVQREWDLTLCALERVFLYLPFEHSEDRSAQEKSLQLFGSLPADPGVQEFAGYARRHHAVITRFGRFPHRNRILGRDSTPEEIAFLREPGSSF